MVTHFTQICFYKQTTVTHSSLYTEQLLCANALTERFVHREAFTHRRLYTQRLSCKEAFTQKKYTDALHYTRILLHSAAFTHRRLYTQTLEHRRFHRHRNFYTEKPLHRTAFTQRISSPPKKLANRYLSLFFFFPFPVVSLPANAC